MLWFWNDFFLNFILLDHFSQDAFVNFELLGLADLTAHFCEDPSDNFIFELLEIWSDRGQYHGPDFLKAYGFVSAAFVYNFTSLFDSVGKVFFFIGEK